MPYLPLLLEEREEISVCLSQDHLMCWAEIGRRIDRCATTVMREVLRHGGRSGYRATAAQRACDKSRKRPKPFKLAAGPLRDRVTTQLRIGRSPYAIWADLIADDLEKIVCVETIYRAVYGRLLDVKPTECLRSRRTRRRSRQARHPNKRAGLPNISLRPAAVNERLEPGHWECDHIIGANNASALMTLTERVSRFSIGITMPLGYTAECVIGGLVEALEQIPAHLRKSITFDQGSEWANWETIKHTYNLDIWFCDPHSPWQRGQIENMNRQWRWWFPRGTNLARLTPTQVNTAANLLNNQRRRHLNNQTPQHLYTQLMH